jgi:hypothetical protein
MLLELAEHLAPASVKVVSRLFRSVDPAEIPGLRFWKGNELNSYLKLGTEYEGRTILIGECPKIDSPGCYGQAKWL